MSSWFILLIFSFFWLNKVFYKFSLYFFFDILTLLSRFHHQNATPDAKKKKKNPPEKKPKLKTKLKQSKARLSLFLWGVGACALIECSIERMNRRSFCSTPSPSHWGPASHSIEHSAIEPQPDALIDGCQQIGWVVDYRQPMSPLGFFAF